MNIDQPLDIAPFAALVRSLAPQLRGPEFASVWQMFYDSFHVELLPPPARDLVRSTCRPRQQVVLGFWRELLEQPAADTTPIIEASTVALRKSGAPYLHVAGAELEPAYRRWLDLHLPAATVEIWPGTGHFPHFADPQRFARRLADTVQWPAR